MISEEEVKHIAKLARLELSEREVEKMQKDLSSILDYFNLLKEAPRLKIKKSLVVTKTTTNQVRKDKVVGKPTSLVNNLMQQAPDTKAGYIKVKAIL